MLKNSCRFCCFLTIIFFSNQAFSLNLTSDQSNYFTTSNITSDDHGISSTFQGTNSNLRTITNLHTITTGNNGLVSTAYGIRTTRIYNSITNSLNAAIVTTGSSGRGISIVGNSQVNNQGSITTQGTTAYGIYVNGDSSTINNSGSIITSNSDSYGIYLSGNNNSANNSGSISTRYYGIYGSGDANQIINSGTITTTTRDSAHGIFVSTGLASNASASNFGRITNSGTINSSGDGIYVKDNYSEINNSGTINSNFSASVYGIKNEGNNVTINNSGVVTAQNYALYNLGNSVIINNYGTLNAAAFLGNSTFNIFNGSSLKNLEGNATSTIVNIGSDSTFNQNYNFTNLLTLNVKSGSTLNSSSAITAQNITIADNAVLNLLEGSSVNAAISGANSSSGTINIWATDFTSSNQIGSNSNKIANLNINSGGSLSTNQNLYISNLTINDGTFDIANNDLTIFGNLSANNGGVVKAGTKSQIITGDLTLNSGSSLSVTLGNNIGNLKVLGNAIIAENVNLLITTTANVGYIKDGSTYQIINANGSLNNIFPINNISLNNRNSNSYGLLTYSTEKQDNSIVLKVTRLESAKFSNNQNARNIYDNLNEIGENATAQLQNFQIALDNKETTISQRENIINQLAPQSSKAMIFHNINLVNSSFQSAENRIDKTRFNNLQNGFWLESFSTNATQEKVKDDAGYKTSGTGFIIGFDREFENNNTAGFLFNFTNTFINSPDNSKKNIVNSYQINFYNSHNFNDYFVDILTAAIVNKYNSSRAIELVGQQSTTSFLGQSYAAKIKTGKNFVAKNGWNLVPEIMLNFVHSKIAGYSENKASTLNLNVAKIDANFLESRIGINFINQKKYRQFPEFTKILMNFGISYGISLINDTPTTISNFANQTTNFKTTISNVDKTSLQLKSEITAYHIDDLSFSAAYNFEHKNTYQGHLFSIKLKQIF